MKLITTIYLAIGFILAMFCIVTYGYVQQTRKLKANIEAVLSTADVIREGEAAQKYILDMETGLRGYLLTGQKPFLEPYHEGKRKFANSIHRLDSMTSNYPQQNKLIDFIQLEAQRWEHDFAVPLIESREKVHRNLQNRAHYDSLFNATAQQGEGKKIMDNARQRFQEISEEESRLKVSRMVNMQATLARTNYIAVGLTLLAVVIGGLTAYVLGNTIKKRFWKMNKLANSIANGQYDVSLADDRQDEISTLTHSLNIMAVKLQNSFAHLTKMNKELDQFAYVVSHDLKAPLRAINNLAEWISEDMVNEDPDIQKNLTILRGRVQRMENLINGILNYSRIGRQALPTTTFSSQDLLKETLENLSPPASFTINIPAALPTVTGERTLLYQVFANLLSNAFKYHHTQQGNINVRYQDKGAFYQFEIQDDGPGIPKEYHDKIFGIFQTMEARDVKESTGIGLSIVKKIIEEKGGQIWVQSEKGQGTTFVFTWPKNSTSATHVNRQLP